MFTDLGGKLHEGSRVRDTSDEGLSVTVAEVAEMLAEHILGGLEG